MQQFKSKGQFLKNFDLSKITRFRTGGIAEFYFIPDDIDDLKNLIRYNNSKLPIYIIGFGSNLLIRDGVLNGITIRLQNPNFSKIELIDNTTIKCGAFASNNSISKFACDNNIGGLEFLSCIPGSIGGGIPTNAGCFKRELKDIIVEIKCIDLNTSDEIILKNADCNFTYRSSNIPKNYIFTEIILKGINGNKDEIKKTMFELNKTKNASQPTLTKTAGSTFKNTDGIPAWKLIQDSGCKDLKCGGAIISPKHSNFIINENNATSQDIEDLITTIQKKVYEKFNIKLETEIKIIGNPIT